VGKLVNLGFCWDYGGARMRAVAMVGLWLDVVRE